MRNVVLNNTYPWCD